MNKADRRLVHELSQCFFCTSKSFGKGISRYPIVTKTARTGVYVPETPTPDLSKLAAKNARIAVIKARKLQLQEEGEALEAELRGLEGEGESFLSFTWL